VNLKISVEKKMANIRTGFSRFSPTSISAILANLIAKLTENATIFSEPPIALAALTALANSLTNAITKATKGSEFARQARDNQVKEVITALNTTANYVRMVANGDGEILAASGFELVKQRVPVGPVGKTLLKAVQMTGVVGEVEVLWMKVPGAYSYQLYRTDSDPAESEVIWTPVVATTKIRCKVNGLTPYKAYWFSVQALGSEGAGAMSVPSIGRAA